VSLVVKDGVLWFTEGSQLVPIDAANYFGKTN